MQKERLLGIPGHIGKWKEKQASKAKKDEKSEMLGRSLKLIFLVPVKGLIFCGDFCFWTDVDVMKRFLGH